MKNLSFEISKKQLQSPALLLLIGLGIFQLGISQAARAENQSILGTMLSNHNIDFDALLMLDTAKADGAYTKNNPDDFDDLSNVRRLRFGIQGDISKNLSAEFGVDVDTEDSSIDVHDASLRYSIAKKKYIELGLVKQPFGLEQSSGSKRLRTLERSIATNAFSPDRGLGVLWARNKSNHYQSLGAFSNPNIDNAFDISARFAWSPVAKKRNAVHLGGSINYRDIGNERFQIRSSGNIEQGRNFLKSAKYDTADLLTLGLEGAWSRKSLLLQAELFSQRLSLEETATEDDPVFTGGYVQASWIFGNGYRKYKGDGFGKIAGTNKSRNSELVAGFSTVDVRHNGTGDKAQEFTLGLNLQVAKSVRLSAQAQRVDVLTNQQSNESGESVSLRIAFDL